MRMIGRTSPGHVGHAERPRQELGDRGSAIRARLGVVPQADQLDNELTVEENLVVYGRYFDISHKECRRRAAELLELAQLTELWPAKLDTEAIRVARGDRMPSAGLGVAGLASPFEGAGSPWGPFARRMPDLPLLAVRIDDSTQAPAVFVVDW